MDQRANRILTAFGAVAIAAFAAGCAESGVATCSTSEECPSGLACQPSGECGVIPCSDGCLEGEVCLQLDEDGNYDPSAEGVCTSTECGGRGAGVCPDGEVCIDGACYPDNGPLACTCNTDCPSGQGCVGGECAAPPAACTDSCECAVGTTCDGGVCAAADLCAGVSCDAGQSCDPATGLCTGGGCDPACNPGETCVDGTCVAGGGGGLCAACSTDDDCGGEGDACVPLGGGTFCAQACSGPGTCPSGFTCFRVDSVVGDQCVPEGGACTGCFATGCADGQFCNAVTQACEAAAGPCEACSTPSQCGPDGSCTQIGGSNYCLTRCDGGAGCGAGYTCQDVRGQQLCAPDGGSCGAACGLTPADCTGRADMVNPTTCICVECIEDTDCGAGQVCTPGGECITSGAPCASISDCPVGQICDSRVGTCVECITPGDCATGEVCVGGICQGCECDPGFRCNVAGECVAVGGDTSDCGGDDSVCEDAAFELSGDPAATGACDGTVGCYTPGVCNGSFLGGGGLPIPLPIPGDFGGSTDVFDAPCPGGTTCDFIFSLDLSGGNLISFACKGCDPSDPESCRDGETCTTPLLPFPDSTPYCSAGGGGGGLPFPLPFP